MSSMGAKDRRRRRHTLWVKQNGKCAGCKIDLSEDEMTIDHVTAQSKGGRNGLKNLQGLCHFCNQEKRDT